MAIQDEMYKAIEKEINQTVESGTEKVSQPLQGCV